MSYDGLVRKQVQKAFILLKDLVKDIELKRSTQATFDFGTGLATTGTITSTKIKAIVRSRIVTELIGDVYTPCQKTEIILNKDEIQDPSVFTEVVIDSVSYKLIPPFMDNGFLVTVEIVRL